MYQNSGTKLKKNPDISITLNDYPQEFSTFLALTQVSNFTDIKNVESVRFKKKHSRGLIQIVVNLTMIFWCSGEASCMK